MTVPLPDSVDDKTEDKFYGQLDNIMMWCFTLGFGAARREYGEQYKSAEEAEPAYEDNLDSWIQDIITGHEELTQTAITTALQELESKLPKKGDTMLTVVNQSRQERHDIEVFNYGVRQRNQTIDQVKALIQEAIPDR